MLSETPSLAFVLIEIGNYLLTAACLYQAWKYDRRLLYIMVSGIIFGFLIEYTNVSHQPPPYEYPESVITLPGPVPLGICLSWGLIFYAVITSVRRLGLSNWVMPLAAACLAIVIDFVTDPSFVAMGFWVWHMPTQWFGVPWSNFIGWMVLVASFVFFQDAACRRFPLKDKPWYLAFGLALLCLLPAYLCFAVIMAGYLWLLSLNLSWLPEQVLVALITALFALPVLYSVPRMRRDNPPEWLVLVVPVYLYAWDMVCLYLSGLYLTDQVMVLIMPMFILAGMAAYLWAYIDKLWPAPPRQAL